MVSLNYNGSRILVSGGAGFIGSALIRHTIENYNVKVLNLDKLNYAANLSSLYSVENSEGYKFIKADLCDYDAIASIINDFEPNYIFHLAAESHVDRSINSPREFINSNIVGTFNFLEAAKNYWEKLDYLKKSNFRFIHVSTDEVYGTLGETGLFSEDTAYSPNSPYSASKAASDHLAKAWYHTYKFPIIVSNCSNNYGPYHFPEKLIPLNIINALEGKPINIYGNGLNIRDWLYVEDHVKALLLICKAGIIGETYNVGGNEERTNLEVINQICNILDRKIPKNAPHAKLIKFVQDRPGHDKRYAIDATKLKNNLGWNANESFETGLEKTIDWFIENQDWWKPIRSSRYNGDRIGLIGKDETNENTRI